MAGPKERVILAAPLATAGNRVIAAPFQFALSGSENLRVRSANSLAGAVIALQGRILLDDGTIHPIVFSHTPNSDRSLKTQDFALGTGTLLTLTVFVSTGAPLRGQTFVQVQVIQGFGGATIALGTLLQGYVTSFQQLAWPGSPIEDSLSGRGWLTIVTPANPPGGSGLTVTAPTGVRWRLQSVDCRLDTDATAVTRQPFIETISGGTVLAHIPPSSYAPPSYVTFFSWVASGNTGNVNQTAPNIRINGAGLGPEIYVRGGDSVVLTGLLLQAGDQFSLVALTVEEWLELN